MAKHRLNEMIDLIDGYVFMPWYNYANIEGAYLVTHPDDVPDM